MKTWALALALVICGIGSTLIYVYFHPIGFVLGSLGFLVFLYAIFSKDEGEIFREYEDRQARKKRIAQEKYICRYCSYFEKPGCKRQEKFINAKPCEDYMLSPWE